MITLAEVLQIVDTEPEFPGDAPPILMQRVDEALQSQNRDYLLHLLRGTVRQTKACIHAHIQQFASDRESSIVTNQPSLGTGPLPPEPEETRAYLLCDNSKLWLAFGVDAVAAAGTLGGDPDRFSVAGSFPIGGPISISAYWPYFTNTPGPHAG